MKCLRVMAINPALRSEIDGPLGTHDEWRGVFVHIKNKYNASDKCFDDMVLHDDCYVMLRD